MIKRARSRRAGKVEVHKTIVDKDMMKWKKLLQSTDVPVENIYYQEEVSHSTK